MKQILSLISVFITLALGSVCLNTHAGSLYLPLKLAPEIEARVERLFVLANMPIIKRPIPIKQIHVALEKLGSKDPLLASSIRRYLERYDGRAAVTHLSLAAVASNNVNQELANLRGTDNDSSYLGSAMGFFQVNDWILINAGGVQTDREQKKDEFADGSFLSVGPDALQIDIGQRPHWLGPFQESDMLMSTNASSLPGITLSNINPLTLFGIRYELFFAQMSSSDGVLSKGDGATRKTGNPRLFGLHLSFAPVDGFAIGFNRLMQYGGADRDNSYNDLIEAFFNVKANENIGERGVDFGNQLSSVTTRYTFAGRLPMSIYMEYAGEDTSYTSDYHLGNTALMFGIHLPKVTSAVDFTYEYGEWQNGWYTNSNYSDGLRQFESPMGHWGANYRVFSDAVGAEAQTAKLIWDITSGQSLTTRWRQLSNKNYSGRDYVDAKEISLEYAYGVGAFIVGATLTSGNTVFDDNYTSLSGYFRW